MATSRKRLDETHDLDISLVSKVNKVAESQLKKYLLGLQAKYDVILYKMQKQIIETRREVDLMQMEKDKIAMKMMKKYKRYPSERGVSNRLRRNLATSTSTLTSLPPVSASNYESASESLPFSNASVSNSETTLEPVFENAPYGTILRPHTLGNPFKTSPRKSKSEKSYKTTGGKVSGLNLRQLNERNLSRMEERFGMNHGRSDHHGEDNSKQDLTFILNIWEKNRCLTRGHLSSGDLSVESVYKLGGLNQGSIPKSRQDVGYEVLNTNRPVRLSPKKPKKRLPSGSSLSGVTVF